MKIAFAATMGIPARYGGFETCVEELATRLIKKGHEIIVYCGYDSGVSPSKEYKGIKLIHIPCIKNKFLDFPFRALICGIDSAFRDCDIVHFFGTDSAPFALIPRIFGKKVVIWLDGRAWERESYPKWVRKLLRLTAGIPFIVSHATTVDSQTVQKWYKINLKKEPVYIPYGAYVLNDVNMKVLEKYGLENKKYILFVGRLVPEKKVGVLIDAYTQLDTNMKLAIVGGDPYDGSYESFLKRKANINTMFIGYVYGEDYIELTKGAYLYVTASELEGTSPALLTAMGCGTCVLAANIPENLETIGDAGFSFKAGNVKNLEEKLRELVSQNDHTIDIQSRAQMRIGEYYNWDKVAEEMERIYRNLLGGR